MLEFAMPPPPHHVINYGKSPSVTSLHCNHLFKQEVAWYIQLKEENGMSVCFTPTLNYSIMGELYFLFAYLDADQTYEI